MLTFFKWLFFWFVIGVIVIIVVAIKKGTPDKEEGVTTEQSSEKQINYQQTERKRVEQDQIAWERQKEIALETRKYFLKSLTDDINYQQLVNFEDRYYSSSVDRDYRKLEVAQEVNDLSTVQGRVSYLKQNDTNLFKQVLAFLVSYRKDYPNASLSECREAFLTKLDTPYNQKWTRPDYFLETAEDVTEFFAGRKPKNGQRLIVVERSKNQLRFFGFTNKDVRKWEDSDCYGKLVYLTFDKKSASYLLVYRVTADDTYVYLSERFDEYVIETPKPKVEPAPKPIQKPNPTYQEPEDLPTSRVQRPVQSPTPAPKPSWYDDLNQAIENEKLPILKDGRDVRTIDWLTEPSLPVFSGIDVYRFATDLDTLGNIMMIAGKHFVGQPAGDWIRFINEKSFGRKRMTKGYQEVYRRALLRLEDRKLIKLRQGIVSAVASKEEPVLTIKRLPKALQGEKE